MAAMIWDTEAQAFKESETPLKYDPYAGAWTETTGMAYNLAAGAWEEKWSAVKQYVLYDNGIFNDTYHVMNCYQNGGSFYKNSTTFVLRSDCGQYRMVFNTPIDLSAFKKFKAIVKITGNGNELVLSVYTDWEYNSGHNWGATCHADFVVNNVYEELELDISSVLGSYRVGFLSVSNSANLQSEFQKVWLE